MQLLISDQ